MAPTFNFQYTSGTNPYIPSYSDGTVRAQLIVDYSRNPKAFIVNKLVTISPVKKTSGYWLRFDQSVLSRVNSLEESVWHDGQEFPMGPHNKQKFTNIHYETTRYGEPYPVGYNERDQAAWDVDKQAQRVLGQRLMTRRALGFKNIATNANNYLASNTGTVETFASLGAGNNWSDATAAAPFVLQTINEVERRTLLTTNGVITRESMVMLMAPTVAYNLSKTQEVHQYLGNSPVALAVLRGEAEGTNKPYQIPDLIYGIRTVVDPTIQNTAARDVTPNLQPTTPGYAFMQPSNSVIFLSRPGDVPENVGDFATAFSSIHLFVYEPDEFVIRSHDEPHNNRLVHQAYDHWDIRIVAHETMYLLTSVFD